MDATYRNLSSGVGMASVGPDPIEKGPAVHIPVAPLEAHSSTHFVLGIWKRDYPFNPGLNRNKLVKVSWRLQ